MITVIVIALALCAVMLFYLAVRSRRKQAGQSFRPVDLNAFRTLMDREDELYMRERLVRSKFLHLKRQRIRVMMRYVARIAGNASAVLHMGEAARVSSAPEVAQAAMQVTELAAQIRLQCLVAMTKLVLEYAMPSLQLTPAMLVPKYQSLRENVRRLGALQTQNPAPLAMAI
jgi:multisubunit Na+/H+ antiporter MnhC subunit